jgi:two-component system KDP operon response regulator KdpE
MSGPAATAGPLVLVVEDELQMRRFLRHGLPPHGYRLLEAETGAEALRMAVQYVPDLVLLDLGLADMDGIEVARRIRAWSALPIIVLSARGEERQKVTLLDAGVDDYLTKPFGFAELLARMRAALRRAARAGGDPPGSPFECGALRIDFDARRVSLGEREVHLTPIEYKLLGVLARHAGKVVTHRQLLTEVWGPNSAEENRYLRVYMTHLRRKLEPDPGAVRIFRTEAGVGYKLECPEREGPGSDGGG